LQFGSQGIFAMASARPARSDGGAQRDGKNHRSGTLASEVINPLRSLYKKSSSKRELVAINEVIGEMVRLLRGEANEYAVSIRTDLAADLPKITADRVQLQHVLMTSCSMVSRR
jgi:signal transduction histidine kinase